MPPRASSKSRSKSPSLKKAKGKAKAKAFDPMDYMDDSLALVLCLVLVFVSGLEPTDPKSLTTLMMDEPEPKHPLPQIGQSALLTLHTLNTCQGRGKKFWLTDLMECVASVFAAGIAKELLSGGDLGPALLGGTESQYTFVIICWYLQNHTIGGVIPNLWDFVTSSPIGAPLQKVMTLATTCYVNGIIMATAAPAEGAGNGAENPFNIAFLPLAKAALVAGATSAIPAKPANDSTTSSALVIAVLISTDGLAKLPTVGANISKLTKAMPFVGSEIKEIYTNLTIASFFLSDILTSAGVPSELLNPGAVVGVWVNKLLNLHA